MSHYDLPFRSRKDLNRAAQMRSFGAPGWPFSSRSAMPPNYQDTYMPSPRPKYDRNSNRAKPYYPPPISPFQKDQSFAPDFPSPFASYRPASSYPHRSSPEYSTNIRLSFPKALRSLKFALDAVLCRAEQLHKSFNLEMQYVPYADERTRAYLWMLKVDYNGWNAEDDPPAERNDRFDPFAKYSARLLGAIDDVQHSDPASSHDWLERPQRQGGTGFDGLVEAEDVRLAMKKLDVSLEAMTELLKGVKADRRRCVVLIRELRSTVEILETIKVVWEVPGSGKGATARSGYQESSSTAASSPSGKTSDTEAGFRGFDDCGYGPPI